MTNRIIEATCHTVEFAEIEAKLRDWPEVEAVGSFREKRNNKKDSTKVFITFDSDISVENSLKKLSEIPGLTLSRNKALKLSDSCNINDVNYNSINKNGNVNDQIAESKNSKVSKGYTHHNKEKYDVFNKVIDVGKSRKGVDLSSELLRLKTRHNNKVSKPRVTNKKSNEARNNVVNKHSAQLRCNGEEEDSHNAPRKPISYHYGNVTVVTNNDHDDHYSHAHHERAYDKQRLRENNKKPRFYDVNIGANSRKNITFTGEKTFTNMSNADAETNKPFPVPPPPPLLEPFMLPFLPLTDPNFGPMPYPPVIPMPFDPFTSVPQPFSLPFPHMPMLPPSPPLPLPPSLSIDIPPLLSTTATTEMPSSSSSAPAPFEASVAFVDNVPFGTTNEQLMKIFSPYGSVVDINRLETMAMICYASPESVQECIQHVNGSKINDNVITVSSGTIRIPARVAAHIGI